MNYRKDRSMKSKQNDTRKQKRQGTEPSDAQRARAEARARAKNDPVRQEKVAQIVSIVLGIVALLFIVSFIFKGVNESGFFGRIFGDLLYGLFSLPAWMIPMLLFYFAAVYRKESVNGTLFVRVAMTVAAFLTFLCIYFYFSVGLAGAEFSLSPVSIWRDGQSFRGSGLVGSYLGYAIFRVFGKVGTPIVLFPLFAVLLVFLFGWTPRQAYLYCKGKLLSLYGAYKLRREESKRIKQEQQGRTAPAGAATVSARHGGGKQPAASRADNNDVLNEGSAKRADLQELGIDIETGEVLDENAIAAPKIHAYGMAEAAAREDSRQSRLKGGTAADIDTLGDFSQPRVASVTPAPVTAAPEPPAPAKRPTPATPREKMPVEADPIP
ncbi:MAG: hypothetical protein E7599_02425, partial [Ruminococcaceae bacterium]|nr:hypothetical protein [Oscillospiraceae bacterium]